MAAGVLVACAATAPDAAEARGRPGCAVPGAAQAAVPGWARQRRMTVLVDSVLLGAIPGLRRAMPCRRIGVRGRPAVMLGAIEREVRGGRRVAPLVVVGVGYNTLWERGRRRFAHWSELFDGNARRLLATLRRKGARQIVWVTLRQPNRRLVGPHAWGELGRYSWYFPYVNERLRLLDRRYDDVILADWRAAANRRGVTYDSIHVNTRGADLMGRTIEHAINDEARRQARRDRTPDPIRESPA
jgi:hypothetical protein